MPRAEAWRNFVVQLITDNARLAVSAHMMYAHGTGTFHSHALSFPGTKLPSNIRSRELSSPTTVALLRRRPTPCTIMSFFNKDYRVHLK